jgi:hypothetical protein
LFELLICSAKTRQENASVKLQMEEKAVKSLEEKVKELEVKLAVAEKAAEP